MVPPTKYTYIEEYKNGIESKEKKKYACFYAYFFSILKWFWFKHLFSKFWINSS